MPTVALNITAPFPVPEAGLMTNQGALSLAAQLSVPAPLLLILTVWVMGLAPPCAAAKERLVRLTPMTGCATGGGGIGGGVTGGGSKGGGDPAGVKVVILLSIDSLLEKS